MRNTKAIRNTGRVFCAAMLVAAVPAVAQIVRPQLGYVIDSSGSLRPVTGIAAAASLGDSALDNARSFACSAKLCLAKTDVALIPFASAGGAGSDVMPQSTPAPPGAALIAIDDQADSSAWIYFTASQQLALWQSGNLTTIDFAPGGEVLSLRAAPGGFDYVVTRYPSQGNLRRRVASAWIEHYAANDGSMTVIGPAAMGAAFADPFAARLVTLIDGGVLAATAGELILARPDGSQTLFPLAGAQAFYNAGKGYIEIAAAEGLWILRTDSGQEQLSLLPGVTKADPTIAEAGAAQ